MAVKKEKKEIDFDVEIGLEDGKEWSTDKLAGTKKLIKELAAKRSPERQLKNEFLAIQYKMEQYAENDDRHISKPIALEVFLQAYLTTLNISFRKFALAIDMNDANLKKYVGGERKFNTDLARKFGRFFHTSPVTWMKVCQLNDLIKLRTEKEGKRYDKYDFKNVVNFSKLNTSASAKMSAVVSDKISAVSSTKKVTTPARKIVPNKQK